MRGIPFIDKWLQTTQESRLINLPRIIQLMKGRAENLMLIPVVLIALIKKRKVHYDELKKNLEGDQFSFKESVTFR